MAETFKVFDHVLSLAGIRIFSESKETSKYWLYFQIWSFFIGLLTFIFTTGFVVSSADTIQWIEGAAIWATGVLMFITFGVCLEFRQQFITFVNEMAFKDIMLEMPLIKFSMKYGRGSKLKKLNKMVVESREKLLNFSRILLKIYVASVFVCATMYILDSIYEMSVTKDETLRLLAFDMWFPWSLENFNVYIGSFIFHAYGGYLCCIAYPGLQTTIILLVGQVIRQLKILTFILLHLNEIATEIIGERDKKWQLYCTMVLSQCVDHYIKLKRFSNRLNVITRPFYLTLIVDAMILVCVCSVKIAISDKLSLDTLKYCVHEFCFILVVLMFCLLGQNVDNKCANLELAITEKWYKFDYKHKKHIRIFQMAASQRMPIYIFGSFTLSSPTFTWFIRNGMSFFTLVMSVLDA